jgi:hypothetical protein
MTEQIFSCCGKLPHFLITYSVGSQEKTYRVCDHCITLDYFSKHIIKKLHCKN